MTNRLGNTNMARNTPSVSDEKIHAYIKNNPGATIGQIAKRFDLGEDTVQGKTRKLRAQEKIYKLGNSKFRHYDIEYSFSGTGKCYRREVLTRRWDRSLQLGDMG